MTLFSPLQCCRDIALPQVFILKKRNRNKFLGRFWMASVVLILIALPVNTSASNANWTQWFVGQVVRQPEVEAARERLIIQGAKSSAMRLPLSAAEWITEVERVGSENNVQLGLQKKVDIWNKRQTLSKEGTYLDSAERAAYQNTLLSSFAQSLKALIEWQAASSSAELFHQQQNRLNQLLEQIEHRQKLGDIDHASAEIIYLSLLQKSMQTVDAEVLEKQAERRVKKYLSLWQPSTGRIPKDFWWQPKTRVIDDLIMEHPRVAQSQNLWLAAKTRDSGANSLERTSPTVGLHIGREGEETLTGLSLSLPLQIRKRSTANRKAITSKALEQEALYHAAFRQQQYAWQSAVDVWQLYQEKNQTWRSSTPERIAQSERLLKNQWTEGDLPLQNYLQALSQHAEVLLAGIELQKKADLALLDVLVQSGELIKIERIMMTSREVD